MIRLVVLLLRVVAVFVLVRLGLRALAVFLKGRRGDSGVGAPDDTDLVRDRVCNTFLPRSRALSISVGGREEHFCSEACRAQALAVR